MAESSTKCGVIASVMVGYQKAASYYFNAHLENFYARLNPKSVWSRVPNKSLPPMAVIAPEQQKRAAALTPQPF
jgi:hypothetical protein